MIPYGVAAPFDFSSEVYMIKEGGGGRKRKPIYMVDFLKELNDYYARNRGKRIKQEFRDVLSSDLDELSGSQKQIYEIYIEPNMALLQETLYEAFKEVDSPLDAWRTAILENPPSIMNQIAKKMVIRAIREMDTGGL
jgi:hypothetical protein